MAGFAVWQQLAQVSSQSATLVRRKMLVERVDSQCDGVWWVAMVGVVTVNMRWTVCAASLWPYHTLAGPGTVYLLSRLQSCTQLNSRQC